MLIKDLLFEYDYTLSKDIAEYKNVGRIKNVADDINLAIDNFIKSCHTKAFNPVELIKTYEKAFDELEAGFKKNVLLNATAKSGIFIWKYKDMDLDVYLKDTYNFQTSRNSLRMTYSLKILQDLVLYEVSLLYHKYNKLYDFQIRYAIIKLLLTRFYMYTQDAPEMFGDNSATYYVDDIMVIYNTVLNTDINTLHSFESSLYDLIVLTKEKRERYTSIQKKPKCKEDLLFYINDDMTQQEKKERIASAYGTSTRTAIRWMKQYDLLQESTMEKHFRKASDEHKDIVDIVKHSKKDIIDILLLEREDRKKEQEEHRKEVSELKQMILDLTNEVKTLRQDLQMCRGLKQTNNTTPVTTDCSGLNMANLNNITL